MIFVSTRNPKTEVAFWQSIVQGVAPDGGLLIPEEINPLPGELITGRSFWEHLTPPKAAALILRQFTPSEVSDQTLEKISAQALNFEIPIQVLDAKTVVVCLDRGPTASFKDVAARILARLFELYCQNHRQKIHLIVATSGDTGVAVASAFGDIPFVTVTVLYPDQGVSEIQEKQMLWVATRYNNVQILPINGNFDDCQDLAKHLQRARGSNPIDVQADILNRFGNTLNKAEAVELLERVKGFNLSSANSINIWRLIPQMTQYFLGYAHLVSIGRIKPGEPIVYAVPTGNVGHLMAGVYAREMGLPIKRLIAGTNANNILANVIGSGTLKHREFVNTSSPSMDILKPSNLERLLQIAATKVGETKQIDFARIQEAAEHCDPDKPLYLSGYGVSQEALSWIQELCWAEDVETDEEVYAMIRHVWAKNDVALDPHATTALIAMKRARAKKAICADDQVVIFETAHPDKFPRALTEAGLQVPKNLKHRALVDISLNHEIMEHKPASLDPSPLTVAMAISEFLN